MKKKYIYIYRKKRNYKLNKSQLFEIYLIWNNIDNINYLAEILLFHYKKQIWKLHDKSVLSGYR